MLLLKGRRTLYWKALKINRNSSILNDNIKNITLFFSGRLIFQLDPDGVQENRHSVLMAH